MTHTLVGIGYSGWTHRARMALDLARVPYRFQAYLPTLGEPALRWRLGRWRGPVSVPVLFPDDGPPVTDSFDIAVWASARSGGWLVPADAVEEVREVNAIASRVLEAGRLRTTRRVLADPAALRESLPPAVRALGPLGLAIGRKAAGDLLARYGGPDHDDDACHAAMVAGLTALRARLAGRSTVLAAFSYADITAATALSFVLPHATTPIGPRSRVRWTEPDLADAFADLVAWRDATYTRWSDRPRVPPPAR